MDPPVAKDDAAMLGRRVGIPVGLGIIVLTAVSTAAGLLLTNGPGRPLVEYDLEVARSLVASRTATVTALTGAATILANSAFVVPVWFGSAAVAAWRTRAWPAPAFLLACVGGEKLTYLFTSIIVGRPRPQVPSVGHVYATNSFPSGHIGSAVSLYGAIVIAVLWHDANRRGRPRPLWVRAALAVGVAAVSAFVGFSRMYRGHHFLSDVIWGAFLGVVWLWLARRVTLDGDERRTAHHAMPSRDETAATVRP